jgi:hypothetical protein
MNHWKRKLGRRMGLDLQYNKTGRGGGVAEVRLRTGRRSCKASQQHRANHKGREEIRANLQEEENASIRERKQEMRSIPLLRSLQKGKGPKN